MNSLRLLVLVIFQFYLFSLQGQEIKNRDNFTVVIDPGHGGKDPGAIGQLGTLEKNITLEAAILISKILKKNTKSIKLPIQCISATIQPYSCKFHVVRTYKLKFNLYSRIFVTIATNVTCFFLA